MKMKKRAEFFVLGLLAAAVILLPVTGRAASKQVMPKKITVYRKGADHDSYLKTNVYTFSYDKSGRLKKLAAYSDVTESSWDYTFSYKKSGKNTVVTSVCHDDEGTSRGTFTFGSNGLLKTNPWKESCTWTFFDKKKSKPEMMIVGKDDVYTFTKKGLPDMYFYFEKSKYKSALAYTVKNGKITGVTEYYLSKPVAELTTAALNKAETILYKYSTSTKKVSMSSAVRWMNWALLLQYVY